MLRAGYRDSINSMMAMIIPVLEGIKGMIPYFTFPNDAFLG
jgi:hypothetical protein